MFQYESNPLPSLLIADLRKAFTIRRRGREDDKGSNWSKNSEKYIKEGRVIVINETVTT